MPKVDTLHQLERALSCRGNEIDMLRFDARSRVSPF